MFAVNAIFATALEFTHPCNALQRILGYKTVCQRMLSTSALFDLPRHLFHSDGFAPIHRACWGDGCLAMIRWSFEVDWASKLCFRKSSGHHHSKAVQVLLEAMQRGSFSNPCALETKLQSSIKNNCPWGGRRSRAASQKWHNLHAVAQLHGSVNSWIDMLLLLEKNMKKHIFRQN